ncbi:MAG: hypothetical protein SFU86_21335 [Pirellulaceae bacterium]|nr:hypothetical protein [Pirellulaceae bacterium]
MDVIGFSTGALAYGDFRRGLALQSSYSLKAIELSALRDVELTPLLASIGALDLANLEYISLHAPSRISVLSERDIAAILLQNAPSNWPIVLHPDVISDFHAWRPFRDRLCIENMDQRKPIGRTASELKPFFIQLPEAMFCLDLGHARQVDPTMSVCYDLIETFGDRIRQVHVSEVNHMSRHVALNAATIASIRRISRHLPSCPWIIESVIPPSEIANEIRRVKSCLHAPLCSPMMSLVD